VVVAVKETALQLCRTQMEARQTGFRPQRLSLQKPDGPGARLQLPCRNSGCGHMPPPSSCVPGLHRSDHDPRKVLWPTKPLPRLRRYWPMALSTWDKVVSASASPVASPSVWKGRPRAVPSRAHAACGTSAGPPARGKATLWLGHPHRFAAVHATRRFWTKLGCNPHPRVAMPPALGAARYCAELRTEWERLGTLQGCEQSTVQRRSASLDCHPPNG